MPPSDPRADRGRRVRIGVLAILLALAAGYVVYLRDLAEPAVRPIAHALRRADPPAPTVVFVVLDTARADHTSLCGYHRPTTPTLDDLVRRGASVTCNAQAPGAWTLPSHATFFTGVEVITHGAEEFVPKGPIVPGMVYANELHSSYFTLAEEFADRGYQTVGVSANPVVAPVTGLSQGFQLGDWPTDDWKEGPRIARSVRDTLRWKVRRDRPLFLFVNLRDAHEPWSDIPDDVGWVPPREGLSYTWEGDGCENQLRWFLTCKPPAAEVAAFTERLVDVYDYGLWRADHALGEILDEMEALGWFDAGQRVVVTSDHGELLGEHGLLYHGVHLWEPISRIPVLVWSEPGRAATPVPPLQDFEVTTSNPPPTFPQGALWGGHVYDLVRDGHLPSILKTPTAIAVPKPSWNQLTDGHVGSATLAAVWHGHEKLLSENGVASRYDLAADPAETAPLAVTSDHAAHAELLRQEAGARTLVNTSKEADRALMEALQAGGYVGEAPTGARRP